MPALGRKWSATYGLEEHADHVECLLRNILAVIHEDGGEHTNSLGLITSCADALDKIAAWRSHVCPDPEDAVDETIDSLEENLSECEDECEDLRGQLFDANEKLGAIRIALKDALREE
jgi:hypothetical protein